MTTFHRAHWKDYKVHVSSMNTFPTAAGLASSAAGYAALVYALARLFCAVETFPGELSTIARQGSGSACRSMYGGFVAWRKGTAENEWLDSKAEQVCGEGHWPELRALILVVSDEKKETSSTAGMSDSVKTSKLLGYRAANLVDSSMAKIEEAYKARDFATFGAITMADSNQFHATCLDTTPPIFYLNDTSRKIISVVHKYNTFKGSVRAAYTFDAGPNAVIYTTSRDLEEIAGLMVRHFPDPRTGTVVQKVARGLLGWPTYLNTNDFEVMEEAERYPIPPELLTICGPDAAEKSRQGRLSASWLGKKLAVALPSWCFSGLVGGREEAFLLLRFVFFLTLVIFVPELVDYWSKEMDVRWIYVTRPGPGPQKVDKTSTSSLIDLDTGENAFKPPPKYGIFTGIVAFARKL